MKTWKNWLQKLLIISPNLYFYSPAQPTAHSPKLIYHIINMSQDASVSLSVSDIYVLETYLTLYLCLPFYQNIDKIMYFLLGPKEFALFFCTCSACCCSWACMLHFSTAWIHMINCTFCYLAIVARTQWDQVSSEAEFYYSFFRFDEIF